MAVRTVREGRDWMVANMPGTDASRVALATLDGLEAVVASRDGDDSSPVDFRCEDILRWSGLEALSEGVMAATAHLVNGGVAVAALEYEVALPDGHGVRLDHAGYVAARDRGEAPDDRTHLVFVVSREAFGEVTATPAMR